MNVRQHIPNFVDGVDPQRVEVNDTAALLAQPFVTHWQNDRDFYRWTFSPYGDEYLLMAEMKDGKYWVVAYVTEPLELPEWRLS